MESVLKSCILAVHSDKPVLHAEARQLLLVSLPLCLTVRTIHEKLWWAYVLRSTLGVSLWEAVFQT